MGFTATGVIGGSFAASWQSFGIAPGLFSTIQSASMTGAAAATTTKMGVLAAAVKNLFSSCDDKTLSDAGNGKKNHKC
jgi:hypothetical protein